MVKKVNTDMKEADKKVRNDLKVKILFLLVSNIYSP